MRIWHISDTHGFEYLLNIPENIDMVIHSGDFSNYYDAYSNFPEAMKFLFWYENLNVKYKILIAGNHDATAFHMKSTFKEECTNRNIIYLENSSVNIEGINIFGTPNTPTFGNWHFMKSRQKMDKHWEKIPDNTDIIVSHGPCKGILDASYNQSNDIEFCGDNALRRHVIERVKPKLMLFGHIHNNKDIINAGTRTIPDCDTIFSNGSVVTDGKFGKLTSNGNILEI